MNPEGTVYNAQGRINRLSVLCIDAYGVAVKNGFEGTVEEWLASLKGDPATDEQVKEAVFEYMKEHPLEDPDSGWNVDLTGYATEEWVQEGYQPKGEYLTEVPTGYATEEFVKNKIAQAQLGGEEVDMSGFAQKSELPTKVSQLENDSGYLTKHQDISGKLDVSELPNAINTALAQAKESGEFDGYTPVKGVDYWTDADKQQFKEEFEEEYIKKMIVTPQMYGAVGDGNADDSVAVQAALDSGYDVFFPSGFNYKVTKTLNVSATRQRLIGNYNNFQSTRKDNSEIILSSANPVFNVTGSAVSFDGLAIVAYDPSQAKEDDRYNAKTATAIVNTENDTGEGCLYVKNCFIAGMNIAISAHGRNITVKDNLIKTCNYGVTLYYDYTGTGNNVQQPNTGFRGVVISRNRFHDIKTVSVQFESGVVRGAIISENMVDVGSALVLFNSNVDGCVINANSVNHCSAVAIRFNADAKCVNISGNTICNDVGVNYPDYHLYFINIENGVVSNNVFTNSGMAAITIMGRTKKTAFCNNTFVNHSIDSSSGAGIIQGRGFDYCTIVGNVVYNDTVKSSDCILQCKNPSDAYPSPTYTTDVIGTKVMCNATNFTSLSKNVKLTDSVIE